MIKWIRKLFGVEPKPNTLDFWMGTAENQDVKHLIGDLRGGIPSKCDFCGRELPVEALHPEEAGDWICLPCLERCEETERREAAREAIVADKPVRQIKKPMKTFQIAGIQVTDAINPYEQACITQAVADQSDLFWVTMVDTDGSCFSAYISRRQIPQIKEFLTQLHQSRIPPQKA